MKKILLLFLAILILPAYSANWKQISEKEYVDIDSIEKYEDSFSTKKREAYSFWIKGLNDKSSFFTELEKYHKKKIWYILSKDLIDCKNKAFSFKAYALYGLDGSIITSQETPDYRIEWNSIVPDSIGERNYYGICSP